MAFIQPSSQPNTPAWDPNFQYDTAAQGIKMRQALAQQITNDQLPTQTQSINGWAIPQGSSTAMANAFNKIAGMYLQGKNIDAMQGLGAQARANLEHDLATDTTSKTDDQYLYKNPENVGPAVPDGNTQSQPDAPDQSDAETARLQSQNDGTGNIPSESAIPAPVLAKAISDLKANPTAAVAADTAIQKTKAAVASGLPPGITAGPGGVAGSWDAPQGGASGSWDAPTPNAAIAPPGAAGAPGAASNAPTPGMPAVPPAQPPAPDQSAAETSRLQQQSNGSGNMPAMSPIPGAALGAAISGTPAAPQPAQPATTQQPNFPSLGQQALDAGVGKLTGGGDQVVIPGKTYTDQQKVNQQIIALANDGPMGQAFAQAMMARQAPNIQKLGPSESAYDFNHPERGALFTSPGMTREQVAVRGQIAEQAAKATTPSQIAAVTKAAIENKIDPSTLSFGSPETQNKTQENATNIAKIRTASAGLGNMTSSLNQLIALIPQMGRTPNPQQIADFNRLKGQIGLPAMRATLGEMGDTGPSRLTDTDVGIASNSVPSWESQMTDGGAANLKSATALRDLVASKKQILDGSVVGDGTNTNNTSVPGYKQPANNVFLKMAGQ